SMTGASNQLVPWTTPVIMGGKLYFAANDGTHGTELWVSDGTSAGTHLVDDTSPSSIGGSIYDGGGLLYHPTNVDPYNFAPMAATSSKVFFLSDGANTSGTMELWVSNGDAAGTHLVKRINMTGAGGQVAPAFEPGLRGFAPFTVMNDKICFAADDGVN